jgi:cytochrome c553
MQRKTDWSHKLTRYLIAFAALLTLIGYSHAQEQDIEQTIATCQSCHGANGVPVSADIPVLEGQEYYYLYVQLKDYKSGLRANPIMSEMVKNLSKDDMKALAQYFSEKPWPKVANELDDGKAGKGSSALTAGQCSQCHSTYQGDSRVPRLAGQQVAYLLQTMQDFKNKVRKNSPAKGSLMDSFSEEELEAMAHHLAGL